MRRCGRWILRFCPPETNGTNREGLGTLTGMLKKPEEYRAANSFAGTGLRGVRPNRPRGPAALVGAGPCPSGRTALRTWHLLLPQSGTRTSATRNPGVAQRNTPVRAQRWRNLRPRAARRSCFDPDSGSGRRCPAQAQWVARQRSQAGCSHTGLLGELNQQIIPWLAELLPHVAQPAPPATISMRSYNPVTPGKLKFTPIFRAPVPFPPPTPHQVIFTLPEYGLQNTVPLIHIWDWL